jgi:hypothetical protein|tara:strand:+ start:313 stop:588 length:276 start_codon:yes stop_codon:yes gene_type:complete
LAEATDGFLGTDLSGARLEGVVVEVFPAGFAGVLFAGGVWTGTWACRVANMSFTVGAWQAASNKQRAMAGNNVPAEYTKKRSEICRNGRCV